MGEAEILARRRELVRASAGLQRTRAGVRLDRLERSSPAMSLVIDLGRRLLTPQLVITAVTLLARRFFASRAR